MKAAPRLHHPPPLIPLLAPSPLQDEADCVICQDRLEGSPDDVGVAATAPGGPNAGCIPPPLLACLGCDPRPGKTHRFHVQCLAAWLRKAARPMCPMCREPIAVGNRCLGHPPVSDPWSSLSLPPPCLLVITACYRAIRVGVESGTAPSNPPSLRPRAPRPLDT
jgi:hypothetical protein